MGFITILIKGSLIAIWDFLKNHISIIIAIVALVFTALKDFIIPYILKPRISMEAKNDEECIEDCGEESQIKSRWLRLKLINKSGFFSNKAKNCYVKLLGIYNSNHEKMHPFSQFPLPWVCYNNYKNDLSKGETHLIDLVYEYGTKRRLYVNGKDYPIPVKLLNKLIPGKYIFKVGVYGDNFNPKFYDFTVELGNQFGELKFIN
ncbi:hypothetical protein HYU23_04785 [Candidatus Woesearchaeota archaeon]|nr:hypothetical protein [Candidatus Woesearchaeota archaeon]